MSTIANMISDLSWATHLWIVVPLPNHPQCPCARNAVVCRFFFTLTLWQSPQTLHGPPNPDAWQRPSWNTYPSISLQGWVRSCLPSFPRCTVSFSPRAVRDCNKPLSPFHASHLSCDLIFIHADGPTINYLLQYSHWGGGATIINVVNEHRHNPEFCKVLKCTCDADIYIQN